MVQPVRNMIAAGMLAALMAAPGVYAASAASSQAKSGKLDGKQLFEDRCLKCHKPAKFKNERHDRKGWEQILSRMQLNTCQITDEEAAAVADYLAKAYGE